MPLPPSLGDRNSYEIVEDGRTGATAFGDLGTFRSWNLQNGFQ